jgi:uncharacterized protein
MSDLRRAAIYHPEDGRTGWSAARSTRADRIDLAYVYGSIAKGEARPDSDVDLMIVGAVSLREVSSAIRAAGRTLQRVVNPTSYASDEYAAELRKENSFVYRVHNGPRIDVIGGKA